MHTPQDRYFARRLVRLGTFLALALVSIFTLATLAAAPAAHACVGPPPEPFCTKTLQLAIGGPPVVLLPAGGTFDVPAAVYFALLDFPAGFGICPGGPFTVDVEVTATCTPGGADGAGDLMGATITTGWNELTVPVTVPAGPARHCVLSANARLTTSDGMTLTESAGNVACLADPAPGMPTQPRLDMRRVAGLDGDVARAHPGDPVGFVYQITNNDPAQSFSGTLTVDSLAESRMPGSSGPMPPGTAVVSVSDPVEGDNFAIELLAGRFELPEGDPVVDGCIALGSPADPAIPSATLDIDLAPLESTFVTVRSRSWGLCADGSCSRTTLSLDGAFSEGSTPFACTGEAFIVDTSEPPRYGCDDSGARSVFLPPVDPSKLTSLVTPRPGLNIPIDTGVAQGTLTENGNPTSAPIPFSGSFTSDRGRIQLQFVGDFAVDSTFAINADILLESLAGTGLTTRIEVLGGFDAPTGFESSAPFVTPIARVEDAITSALLGFYESAIQLNAVGIDNLGQRRPLSFGSIQFGLLTGGAGVDVVLGGGTVDEGDGDILDAIEVSFDLRGFMAPEASGFVIFEDGFESGNTSRWSLSAP